MLRGQIADLVTVGAVVDEYVEFGVNANTAQKDARAWEFWEVVCEAQGTSPLRTPNDVRDHPERQSHLLAALLMYAFAVCEPRNRTRRFVKPRSALAYPLAIIRIFGRWGIAMPGYKALVAALNGLMRLYINYHGPHSLAPRRAEPMKFSMMRDIYHAAPSVPVGGRRWTDADHDVFVFVRLNVFLMYTAFRLGEIVAHRSGEIMFITYACLVWCICGVIVIDPTPAQLRALRPGLDYALVAPPRSKPDQWGEIHCPFPVTLTFNTEPDNPAAALRDIELRCPCHGAERQTRPLFGDASGSPYSHAFLSAMLKAILTYLYGAAVASLFTFHSYRSGLATALHAAGVPDAMIQLICRWMCPESLHVYRRIGTRENEAHTLKASAATIDVLQAVNAPRVAADDGYANLVSTLQGTRGRAAQREYEEALAAVQSGHRPAPPRETAPTPRRATPPTSAPPPPAPAPPAQPPVLAALEGEPRIGDSVFVPRAVWPRYACREYGGAGWAATVVNTARYTCVVEFNHARAPDGRRSADERVARHMLRRIV